MTEEKKTRVKNGGRTKGTPNVTTTKMKEMALASLDRVGGVDYFVKQAHENPTAYLAFIAKMIPKEVDAKVEHKGVVIMASSADERL